MNGEDQSFYEFESFRLNIAERQLLNNDVAVPLTPRAFDVLAVLVEHSGHLVEKDELLRVVWADSFVEEANLARIIYTLRKVLGENETGGKFIETVAKKGYRFVAKVQASDKRSASSSVETEPKAAGSIIETESQSTANPTNQAAGETVDPTENRSPVRQRPVRKLFIFGLGGILLIAVLSLGFYMFSKAENVNNRFRQLKFSRLTNNGNIKLLTVSPDGKFMAFVSDEKDGVSISVRQLEMSNSINLVPPKKGHFSFLTFSPDGAFIYYGFYSGEKPDTEIYSVPTLGGMIRKFPNLIAYWMSFAPDGKRFAHVVSNMLKGEKALVINSLEGTERKILTTRKTPRSFNVTEQSCAWSPDGKMIAVIGNEVEAEAKFSVIIGVDAADGSEKPLSAKRWSYIHSVQWLKDGSGLIVTGSDDGQSQNQIWFVSATTGQTQLLTNDLYNYSFIGVTADSRQLIAQQETQTSSFWFGSLGDDLKDFKEIISETGTLDTIVWTTDNRIIFRSNADGHSNLWTMRADGSQRKQLTVDAKVDARGLCVTPDGKRVIFPSGKNGKVNLWSIETDGGEVRQLTDGDGEYYPLCSPDNRSVIYQKGFGFGVNSTIWKTSLTSGGEPVQLTSQFSMRPFLSADGRRLAFFYLTDEVWWIGIMSAEGGRIEQSIEVPEGVPDRLGLWSPDGKSILLVVNKGGVGNVWQLPLDQSSPRQITNFNSLRIEHFFLTDTGKKLVVTRTVTSNDVVSLSWLP